MTAIRAALDRLLAVLYVWAAWVRIVALLGLACLALYATWEGLTSDHVILFALGLFGFGGVSIREDLINGLRQEPDAGCHRAPAVLR